MIKILLLPVIPSTVEHNRALIRSFTAHYLVENFSLWPEFINVRCMFDQRWVCNDSNNILPTLTHWVTWRYNYPHFKDWRSKTERVSHFPKVLLARQALWSLAAWLQSLCCSLPLLHSDWPASVFANRLLLCALRRVRSCLPLSFY